VPHRITRQAGRSAVSLRYMTWTWLGRGARYLGAGSTRRVRAGSLCGDLVIARYFARLPPVPNAPSQMYGTPNDAMSASQVDEFIDSADALATANGGSLSAVLTSLNSRLAMRATLCGHSVRRVPCPLRLPPSPAHTPPVASCLPPGLARRRGHVAGPEAQLAG